MSEEAAKYGVLGLLPYSDDPWSLGTLTAQDLPDNRTIPVGGKWVNSHHYSGGYTLQEHVVRTGFLTGEITALALQRQGSNETLWVLNGILPVGLLSEPFSIQGAFRGSDVLVGNSSTNVLQGWGGDDHLDGGAGIDTAVFSGSIQQYTRTPGATPGSIVIRGPDGTDSVTGIERLRFDDVSVAFDVQGTAGQAYRLYQAAFDRAPDWSGLGFHIRALDHGHALTAVAQNFLNSPEFQRTYGGLNNDAFVTTLYRNVLDRAPDAAGLTFHSTSLASGTDRALLLVHFSESPENQASLIGSIAEGIVYQL